MMSKLSLVRSALQMRSPSVMLVRCASQVPTRYTKNWLDPPEPIKYRPGVEEEPEPEDFYERYGKHEANIPLPLPTRGPERDLVNFPGPVQLEFSYPTRHLVFPIDWFDFFYPKTGTLGPYIWGVGLLNFLGQKEWYIFHGVEHVTLVWCLIYVYIFSKTPIGYNLRNWIYNYSSAAEQAHAKNIYEWNVRSQKTAIEFEEKDQWHMKGQFQVFTAKRENIAFQLEAAYRQQAVDAYNKVKRRLDYLVEAEQVDSRIRQKYMIDWVIENVKKAISPEQEKESIRKCISDLQLLAAKA